MKPQKTKTNLNERTKTNKFLVLDSGPIISLTTNNLLWTLKLISQKTGVQMIIPPAVKEELVDKPLKTKRFELEAFQIVRQIEEGNLKVEKNPNAELVNEILSIANNTFFANNTPLKIIHHAEMEAILLAKEKGDNYVAIDERTARMIIENPEKLRELLENRLHTKIKVNKNNMNTLKRLFKNIHVIRSTELMLIAYKLGLFDESLRTMKEIGPINHSNVPSSFIDGLLWGLKIRGTAISKEEIKQLKLKILNSN